MSRGLGQGELLDVRPTRKLVVAEGHTAYWGVDSSTKRVALATVDAEGRRGVSLAPFPGLDGMARLPEIHMETYALACSVLSTGVVPGVIAVEMPAAPKARAVNPPLYYAVGVICAALQLAVFEETCRRVHLEMVVGSAWKALACGRGNIWKPKKEKGMPAPAPEDYAVLGWAREQGYRGSSWDAADAWGIADWARRTFALEAR